MKKTLLLADDSPTIQKVINLTFADEGIDVISVGDGNAAVQQLRELKPDLVMADVHMPGLNGYQICERIRQNPELSKVPVILLVGSFEPFDEEEAKRVGADDFLMKPFQSIRQLVSRVAALLEQAPAEQVAVTEIAAVPETAQTPPEIFAAGPVAEQENPYSTETVQTEALFAAPAAPETTAETENVTDYIPGYVTGYVTAQEAPAQEVSQEIAAQETRVETPSVTPPDVFHSPWTYAAENTAETAPTSAPSVEVTQEVDDLSDFDAEFDQKFPDAAALSSSEIFSDIPLFSPPEREPEPTAYTFAETHQEPIAERYTDEAIEGSAQDLIEDHSLDVAANVTEELQVEQPVEFVPETIPESAPETLEEAPQRIFDDEEVELAAPNEQDSILDLDGFSSLVRPQQSSQYSEVQEDLDLSEASVADIISEVQEPIAAYTETSAPEIETQSPEIMAVTDESEETEEASFQAAEIAPSAANYDFRSSDAFDDDTTIQESFQGVQRVEYIPEATPVLETVAEEVPAVASDIGPVEEAPQRVVDEHPSEISEDQAAGFSAPAVSVPVSSPVSGAAPDAEPQMSPDAIEAIAQRVSEKLLEKLVRNLAPDMKNLIISEISGDKDQNE